MVGEEIEYEMEENADEGEMELEDQSIQDTTVPYCKAMCAAGQLTPIFRFISEREQESNNSKQRRKRACGHSLRVTGFVFKLK